MKSLLVLCLIGAAAAGGWYFWQENSSPAGVSDLLMEKPAAAVAVVKPEPVKKVTVKPEVVIEPEKKVEPVAVEMEETPVSEPEVVVEAPVVDEKSDLDILLEQTYPLPDFKPLIELVENWTNVPTRAFPPQITVNQPVEYELKSGSQVIGKSKLPAVHKATPMRFKPGSLLISALSNPNMRAVVSIDDTDFKARVQQLYDKKVADARARVLARREEMRTEVASSLAMSDASAAKTELISQPVVRTPLASKVASSYGKGFRGDYYPEIRNGKGQTKDQEVPLGPIGGKMAVIYNEKDAKIVELWDKGPGAKAGLEVGDLIVRANGKPFKTYSSKSGAGPDGAPEAIGLAIVDSQASGKPLELGVVRAGKEMMIEVPLPQLPEFSESFPANCERSSALIEASAQWLADNQKEDGLWKSNQYSSAWCALSLLATGDPKYKRQIKKAARFLADKYEMGKDPSQTDLLEKTGGLDNWQNCMVGIFLGEYLLATGDEAVLDALIANCRRMESRLQKETGRLGHTSNSLPYSGKGLVIINVHAHIMWALAAQSYNLEWDWEAWDLSYKSIEASMTKEAAVGYNFSARSGGQSGSRTGAIATALVLADKESSTARKMGSWLSEHRREFPNTHAMTSLGIVFGFMGIKNTGDSDFRKCLDDYRWMYSLVTPGNLDHGSYYYGCRANHGGDGYCNRRLVGNWVTLITLCAQRDDTLWMFGNRKKGWYE